MKKMRMLFVGSLPTKKVHFNGETNKTGDIYNLLKAKDKYKITTINLTHFKIFFVIKMILLSIFAKYDVVFVSKCVVGGSLAIHLINKFGRKYNKNNIYYYWIGNGTEGLNENKVFFEDLKTCKNIIFESEQIYNDYTTIAINGHTICPCIKHNFDLGLKQKNYETNQNIKCIYFSRIAEQKGLMDAIIAIERANEKIGYKFFSLDIAGAPTSNEAKLFEKKVIEYIQGKEEFRYFGKTFCVTGIETYQRLQEYDLHLFPSQFKQECVPGSIVDMFIAGVPTLASSFPNVYNLLSNDDSYIFKQGDLNDLVDKLFYVYQHTSELNEKRKLSYDLRKKYDEDSFCTLMNSIGISM